jgi:tRNA modification GTPase
MYQYKGLEDTVAAISTSLGEGGIGIVRLSGPDAIAIADRMFQTKTSRKPSSLESCRVHYGWVVDNQCEPPEMIDEALLTVMRAPKSYTREDVVEISCHGGAVPLKAILTLAIDFGARLAEAGEFTKRAFLNGRIDLTQAEAVLDIIHAKTEAFLKVSHHQLRGELSLELESIREILMSVYTEIEAIVNFPEDEINSAGVIKILKQINNVKSRVDHLLVSSEHGKILKEGIKIVICGRPNVGKSSLLNALLKEPRAIVSEIAGTTRDTIEESAQIHGIPFRLVDTAGVLEPRDLIEKEAVRRSHLLMEQAELILLMLDGSQNFSCEDEELIRRITEKNILVIINKSDQPQKLSEQTLKKFFSERPLIKISVLNKQGLDELQDKIVQNVWPGQVESSSGLLISNLRHIQALKQGREALQKGIQILEDQLSLEFVSEEIKVAINSLDAITGRNIDMDLLNKIFSEFCIGK